MPNYEEDIELKVVEKTKIPKMYEVILINDDFTPMDFVVWIIQEVFHKNLQEASRLMMEVHKKGKASMGIFTFDIARSKAKEVELMAKKNEYPLQCSFLEVS